MEYFISAKEFAERVTLSGQSTSLEEFGKLWLTEYYDKLTGKLKEEINKARFVCQVFEVTSKNNLRPVMGGQVYMTVEDMIKATKQGLVVFQTARSATYMKKKYAEGIFDRLKSRPVEEDIDRDSYAVVDIDFPTVDEVDVNTPNKIFCYGKQMLFFVEQLVHFLPKELTPSRIDFSGRGLHFHYKWTEDYYYNREKARQVRLQKGFSKDVRRKLTDMLSIELNNFLAETNASVLFHQPRVDAASKNPKQGFRTPGSYNPRTGLYATTIMVSDTTHTLEDVSLFYGENYAPSYCSSDKKDWKKKKKKATTQPVAGAFDLSKDEEVRKLHEYRLEKMQELTKFRKENGSLVGTRNKILCQITTDLYKVLDASNRDLLLEYALDFNEEHFQEDALSQTEVKNSVYSLFRSLEAGKWNKLRSRTVANFVELTDEEASAIRFAQANQTEKRKQKQEEKKALKLRAGSLYHELKSITKVAKLLNISWKTAKAYILDAAQLEKETKHQQKQARKLKNDMHKRSFKRRAKALRSIFSVGKQLFNTQKDNLSERLKATTLKNEVAYSISLDLLSCLKDKVYHQYIVSYPPPNE